MCHIYSIKLNKLNTATLGSCPDKYQPFLYCNNVQLLYTERTFYLIGMSTIMCQKNCLYLISFSQRTDRDYLHASLSLLSSFQLSQRLPPFLIEPIQQTEIKGTLANASEESFKTDLYQNVSSRMQSSCARPRAKTGIRTWKVGKKKKILENI